MTAELRIGWTASIVLHLLLLLLALLYVLPSVTSRTEFIELEWGNLPAAPAVVTSAPAPSAPASTVRRAPVVAKRTPTATPARRSLPLPERRLPDLTEEAIAVPPRTDKIDLPGPETTPDRANRSSADRQDPVGSREVTVPGRTTDRPGSMPSGSGIGEGVSRPGSGGAGSGVGFDVQWTGGGSRKKLSGEIPKYPEGTNVAAQVRIRTWVLPNGSVRAVQPVQKANTALEDAAMKELKLWKFEPLPPTMPQVEQDCVVTFQFKLR
jgi:TonB family protein